MQGHGAATAASSQVLGRASSRQQVQPGRNAAGAGGTSSVEQGVGAQARMTADEISRGDGRRDEDTSTAADGGSARSASRADDGTAQRGRECRNGGSRAPHGRVAQGWRRGVGGVGAEDEQGQVRFGGEGGGRAVPFGRTSRVFFVNGPGQNFRGPLLKFACDTSSMGAESGRLAPT